MSRYPIRPKSVQGKPCNQRKFLEVITTIIGDYENGVSADVIAVALGPEWISPPASTTLRQTLVNMKNRGALERVEEGIYKLHPRFDRRGVNRTNRNEIDILTFMRKNGGIARPREILLDFHPNIDPPRTRRVGVHQADEIRNSAEYSRINKTLARMRDEGTILDILTGIANDRSWESGISDGTYCLPFHEFGNIIMTGRSHTLLLKFWARETFGQGGVGAEWRDRFEAARDHVLTNVALTMTRAREATRLTTSDVAAAPDVLRELNVLAVRATKDMILLEQDITDEIEKQVIGEHREDDLDRREELRMSLSNRIPERLYERLEGFRSRNKWPFSVLPHYYASPALYQALAQLYRVDAVALSRGVLIPVG